MKNEPAVCVEAVLTELRPLAQGHMYHVGLVMCGNLVNKGDTRVLNLNRIAIFESRWMSHMSVSVCVQCACKAQLLLP